jgi:hypothetical protein
MIRTPGAACAEVELTAPKAGIRFMQFSPSWSSVLRLFYPVSAGRGIVPVCGRRGIALAPVR